jgi:FAD/FMN-containing dehydrogenase
MLSRSLSSTNNSTSGIKRVSQILSTMLGRENVSTGESVRSTHGQDQSHHVGQSPDVVCWPRNVPEVCEIARLCNRY